MRDYAQQPPHTDADYHPGKQVKLPNRRVALWRAKDGSVILCFKILRGWKQITRLMVPLSAEGAKATLDLLLASEPSRLARIARKPESP